MELVTVVVSSVVSGLGSIKLGGPRRLGRPNRLVLSVNHSTSRPPATAV
jgi:hypothetical protein